MSSQIQILKANPLEYKELYLYNFHTNWDF